MDQRNVNLLAIETATKSCSIAVARSNELLGETSLYVPQVHVERLVVMINSLLSDLRLKKADLDAIGVSIGPGSFTGLRIGLSVAKGIAFALDKKIIGVPTLEAIARGAAAFSGGRVVVPLLHARGDEFYYASYPGGARRDGDERCRVAGAEKIAEEFEPTALFVGEGVQKFRESRDAARKFGEKSLVETRASARDIAAIAVSKFERGEAADLRSAVPLYIKDFVAIKGNPLNKLLEKA